jgi:hypothetical protein
MGLYEGDGEDEKEGLDHSDSVFIVISEGSSGVPVSRRMMMVAQFPISPNCPQS